MGLQKKEATFNQMHDENAVVDDVTLAGVRTRARACWLVRVMHEPEDRLKNTSFFLPGTPELLGLLEKHFKLAANFFALV